MKADAFLDSNVLLYAAANVHKEAAKKEAALRLIAESDFGTSVQVLGEFYDNACRKAKLAIPATKSKEILALLKARPLAEQTTALFDMVGTTSRASQTFCHQCFRRFRFP
ncbi:MAG TPA: hypothetical protein VHH88_09915 [Verrucomicrobiae bacterium]|nr:hypothetical protein [Verrucomicrobiae bacterium]